MAETNIHKITWGEVTERVRRKLGLETALSLDTYWGVPRGGAVVAAMTGRPANSPESASIIVDDIVDSGRTRARYESLYPRKRFIALFDKKEPEFQGKWIHFPWEPEPAADIGETITRQLEFIGEDAAREGLRETPARVVRAWGEMYGGYRADPEALFKTFQEGACHEMVVLRDIDFYSTCEHHLLPFFGHVSIGYLPRNRVIGVSKIARLVDVFSRRLQIQERMTSQIADTIGKHLDPEGVMVVCRARHLCMMARGIKKHAPEMVTSAIRGSFERPEVRQEFLSIIGPGGGR